VKDLGKDTNLLVVIFLTSCDGQTLMCFAERELGISTTKASPIIERLGLRCMIDIAQPLPARR
jgi:hypothetical protein